MFGIGIVDGGLVWQENLPRPALQPYEVLIRTAYAGVNRADLFQKQGKYPPPPGASPLPGLEVSGTIVAVGGDVSGWNEGDEVCALLEGGGYAEYCTVSAGQILPIPPGWTLREAAVLPEALFTCWLTLVETARLRLGERLLIHGGASGIGSVATQLAKCLGAQVIATARGENKMHFCRRQGADLAIDYTAQDFAQAVPSQSVDVILDMVGGDYMANNLGLLRPEGRLVQIAFLRGARAELNMAPLLLNRLSWHGITLRAQGTARKAALTQAILDGCWSWLAQKSLLPPIDSEFPLKEAEKAHKRMEQSLNLGKIVLELPTS